MVRVVNFLLCVFCLNLKIIKHLIFFKYSNTIFLKDQFHFVPRGNKLVAGMARGSDLPFDCQNWEPVKGRNIVFYVWVETLLHVTILLGGLWVPQKQENQ